MTPKNPVAALWTQRLPRPTNYPAKARVICGKAANISDPIASWGLGHLQLPENRVGIIPDLSSTSSAPRADKFENDEREVRCEAKPPQGFLSLWPQSESVLFLLMRQKKGLDLFNVWIPDQVRDDGVEREK